MFRRLTIDDIQSWFGPVPTDETKARLGFKDLQVVLETIAGRTVTPDQEVKDVPMRENRSERIVGKCGYFVKGWHGQSATG